MKCPSCKTVVGDKDLACPNCKKVLRLKCHVCGVVTKNSTCENCGTVLLNKCYKCGKLNNAAMNKCPKCGMDINASIALRESIIEEFAVLTVDFRNFDEIRAVLKSEKLAKKFQNNLYEIIKKNALQKKLRVQIVDGIYIIRFCKDYSYLESCKSALDFSILIAQTVADLNKKLIELKGIELKVQMAILKRDVYAKAQDYKSGLSINTVYSSDDTMRNLNSIEVAVDSFVYQVTKDIYPFQSLAAVYVKNRMVMFFELILAKLIKIENELSVDAELVDLPAHIDFEPDESYLNQQLIDFNTLSCSFIYSKQTTIIKDLQKIASKSLSNPIISVRSQDRIGKLYALKNDVIQDIFSDYKIFRLSCSDLNKYNAYGLLKQMLLSYNNYNEIELLTNSLIVDALSTNEKVKNLLLMDVQSNELPEDFRYFYFESFTNFISSIPFKTLFVIDDIQNADEASLEIIKYAYENQRMGNVGLVVTSNTEFALHRKICQLMMSPSYFDIEIKPSANKKLVEYLKNSIFDIKNTFFFEKALENTKGSLFYLEQALNYLVDVGVFAYDNQKYSLLNEKMVVIPSEIDELIQKRVKHLKTVDNLFELYALFLLVGEKLPINLLINLNIKKLPKLLEQLQSRGLIQIIDDKELIITNYLLYKKNFFAIVAPDELEGIANKILQSLFVNIISSDSRIAFILEFAGLKKEGFSHWHKLAMVSSRLGAFSEYLNCTNKFLSLVENVIDPETDKNVEQIKFDVYEELATVMYKYYPSKVVTYLQAVLTECEHQQDKAKITDISNKLVQCCLMSGYYKDALEYIGKIISYSPNISYNPKDRYFDLSYFFLNLVIIEIYFNLGRLSECIELGKDLLFNINIEEFKNSILSEKFSKQTFDESMLDAIFYVLFSMVLTSHTNCREYIVKIINSPLGRYNCFSLLLNVLELLEGKDISITIEQYAECELTDKYSEVLLPILQAFSSFIANDWEAFSNQIYTAKVNSSIHNLYQINCFCELMIGFAYQKIDNIDKAKQIFYNVLDIAAERGFKTISFLCWYLISALEFACHDFERAISIINTSLLQLEKDVNSTELVTLLFKILMSEVMLSSGRNIEQALFCAEQAFDIALKNRQFIFVNKIANILIYIYNTILNTETDVNLIQNFQNKINNLNNFMSQFMNN